jgi:hypothetical protein
LVIGSTEAKENRMRRLLVGFLALFLLVGAAAFSGDKLVQPALQISSEERNPWSHLALNNNPDHFRFAIVSDRTGGHRENVFTRTVEKLNLLQPEFVLSVGDLIEGGKAAASEKLEAQWKEFQGFIGRLQMPFFYLPGNHDISSPDMEKLWQAKFGRRYYHFVYRHVLFLMLNSEDPPGIGAGHLSAEQIAYVRRVLDDNRAVRWTIVCMHKPLWSAAGVAKTGWLEVEKALANRPHTVFVGHKHIYKRFVRNGHVYYQLATTGGASKMRGVPYGEFDHVVLVTMKDRGPVLANVLVDGIVREDLQEFEAKEPGTHRVVRPAQPVHGQVRFEGRPVADARVYLHPEDAKATGTVRPEGQTAANGTFILTTHTRNDGAPAGRYIVTVECPAAPAEDQAPAGTSLPPRYAKPETSDLRAVVQDGLNQFTLDLKK